jgi:hypothetical protein
MSAGGSPAENLKMDSPLTPLELKKLLTEQGFEVYRTVGNRVLLAERVRDNLIMDSNVSALAGESLAARLTVRAQQADFHGELESQLFARAVAVAKMAIERGYREVDRAIVPIIDPSDRTHTLDTWYEISVERSVENLAELVQEIRFLIAIEKVAADVRGITG